MTKQELDLFEFAAGHVTEPGARAAQIVGRDLLDADVPREILDHVPDHPFRQTLSPDDTVFTDGPQQPPRRCTRRLGPLVNSRFHPLRNRYRSNVPTFSNEVDERPVVFPALEMLHLKMNRFGPTQIAAQEDSENRTVSLAAQSFRRWGIHQRAALIGGEPVAEADAELLRTLDSTYSCGKFGTQQTASEAS